MIISHLYSVAEGNDLAVKVRVEQIRRQIGETESSYDKEKLQECLAKLSGGVVVVKVGAACHIHDFL